MDQDMAELTEKIDALTAQVAYLTEQARASERERAERDELFESLKPVGKDLMRLATEQLQDVEYYVDLPDLLRILKKAARHSADFEYFLDQIDTVTGLFEVSQPVLREAMNMATEVLGEMEHKGYFGFAREGMRMADNVVSAFTEEDARRLGDNLVLILNTVKQMTQPEILNFLHDTLLVAEVEAEKPVDTSYLALLNHMRDPAVRRGLALTMRVLHVVGAQGAPVKPALPK